jgi:hypothetical protein
MTVILDTNVVLDVLLKRTPHFEKSALVLLLSEIFFLLLNKMNNASSAQSVIIK